MKERLEQRNGKAVAVAVAVENMHSARNITPNAPLTPHATAPLRSYIYHRSKPIIDSLHII